MSAQRPLVILTAWSLNALLLVGGCRQGQPTTTLRHVTIAQVGDFFLYAPLYVAKDAGLFQREGLDVSVVNTGGDDKTWAAVISGSAAFGVGDPTFVAISSSRGQPGRVVASLVNGVPFWGVTFDSTIRPIGSPAELREHSVATFPRPSTAFVLQEMMFRDGRLPPKIVQGGFGTLLAMAKSHRADIALELEPNVSTAVSEGAHVVYSLADQYGEFAITGLASTPSYIQSHSVETKAVVCALQRALDLIHSTPDSALTLLRKRFPSIPAAVARDALERASNSGIVPTTAAISSAAWRKAVDVRIAVGDLPASEAESLFVDNSYATAAATSCRK